MRHADKCHRAGFSDRQAQACHLRRRVLAGLPLHGGAVAELLDVLYGDDYVASTVAAEVLGDVGCREALVPLIETVFYVDPAARYFARRLRCAAIESLRRIAPDDDMAVGTFVAASRDPDVMVAAAALVALGACRAHVNRAIRALTPCLQHEERAVSQAARRSLASLGA